MSSSAGASWKMTKTPVSDCPGAVVRRETRRAQTITRIDLEVSAFILWEKREVILAERPPTTPPTERSRKVGNMSNTFLSGRKDSRFFLASPPICNGAVFHLSAVEKQAAQTHAHTLTFTAEHLTKPPRRSFVVCFVSDLFLRLFGRCTPETHQWLE